MSTFDKIKWVLGIGLVFLLVLMTNLVDRQNFTVVRDSMETIYADRLIAQDIIYELSEAVWRKQLLHAAGGVGGGSGQQRLNTQLQDDLNRFADTELTQQEAVVFERLRSGVEELIRSQSPTPALFERVRQDLGDLSTIQVEEGERQLFTSRKAIGNAELFTQLEIAALVVLAIAVQFIILYTPRQEESPDDRV